MAIVYLILFLTLVLKITSSQPVEYQATNSQIQHLKSNTGGIPNACLCENSVLNCTAPAMTEFNMTTADGTQYSVTPSVHYTSQSGIYTQSKQGTMFDNFCSAGYGRDAFEFTPCDEGGYSNGTNSVFLQSTMDSPKPWCQTTTFDMEYSYGDLYNAFEQTSKVHQNGTVMSDVDYTVVTSCGMLQATQGWLMMNNASYTGLSLPIDSQALNWFANDNVYYETVQSYLDTAKHQASPQISREVASVFYGGQTLPVWQQNLGQCNTYQVVGNKPYQNSTLATCTMNIQIQTSSQTCFQIKDCENASGSYTFSNSTSIDEMISLRYEGEQCQAQSCILTGNETWSNSQSDKCNIWFSESSKCDFFANPNSTSGLSQTMSSSCLFNPANHVQTTVASTEVTESGPSSRHSSFLDEIWDWFLGISVIAVMICVVIVIITSLPGVFRRGPNQQDIGNISESTDVDHPIPFDRYKQSPLVASMIVVVYSSVVTIFYIMDEIDYYVSMTKTLIMFMIWICLFVTIAMVVVKLNHISVTSALGLALGTFSTFFESIIGEWFSIAFALIYLGKLYKCDTTSETTFILTVMASQTYTFTKMMQSWPCNGKGANEVGAVISVWMLIVSAYFSLKPRRNLLAVSGISAIILYFTRIEEEAFAACQSERVKSIFLALIQVSSVVTFLISLVVWFMKDRIYASGQNKDQINQSQGNNIEEANQNESEMLIGNGQKENEMPIGKKEQKLNDNEGTSDGELLDPYPI